MESEFKTIILNALIVVAGLAWNEAFRKFFDSFKITQRYGMFVYAVLLTCIVCIVIITIK